MKQAVIAGYFGVTELTDTYFMANGFVGGIAQAIVLSLSFSTLGVYTNTRIQEGREKASELVSSLFGVLFIVSIFIITGIFIFTPQISYMLAPTYRTEQAQLLQFFLKVSSFSFLFIAIKMIGNSVLDSEKNFILPRLQSFIVSISIIVLCILWAKKLSVLSLVIGQYIADVIYCVILIYGIRKFINFKFIRLVRPEKRTYKIFRLAIPLFIGNGMIQLNQIVDKSISSGLSTGSVSSLSYSQTLTQFVTSVMIVNIGNVLFAHFANFVAENNSDKVHDTLTSTLNLLLYILIPTSVITLLCTDEIVRIVYYRGTFSLENVQMTTRVVRGYSIAFVFLGIRDILTKSMYAYQDTCSPMVNGVLAIVLNIILSIVLSRYIGVLGIALGTSISALVTMLLNMKSFKKILPSFSYRPLLYAVFKTLPAVFSLCIVINLCKKFFLGDLLRFVGVTIFGFIVYFLVLYWFKADEIILIYKTLINKLRGRQYE